MGNILNTDNNKISLDKMVNAIAAKYILTQNFQDMRKLSDQNYCNNLVILTAKVLKKNMTDADIMYLNKRFVAEGDKTTEKKDLITEHMNYTTKDNFPKLVVSNTDDNKLNMCIGIAKFYVKIAHLFSAIATTVNPTFDINVPSKGAPRTNMPPTNMPPTSVVDKAQEKPPAATPLKDVATITPMSMPTPVKEFTKMPVGGAEPITQPANAMPANAMPANAMPANANTTYDTTPKSIPLQDKEKLPENTKEVKVKFTLCDQRLNALLNDKKDILNRTEFKRPNICNMNSNLSTETGIPELYELYKDEYDYKNGVFDVSDKMRKVYENDVKTFYKMFTGNDVVPPDIKTFNDIPLRNFKDSIICKNDAENSRDYTVTVKDKLFKKYANHLKDMMKNSERKQQNLVNQLNKLFLTNEVGTNEVGTNEVGTNEVGTNEVGTNEVGTNEVGTNEVGTNEVGTNEVGTNEVGTNEVGTNEADSYDVTIQPDLNEQKLQQILEETRSIIVDLYITCEKDFYEGVKIFEAIIEAQIFATNIERQKNT